MIECPQIEGAQIVLNWFGYWPSFHDAEVVSILLDRSGKSKVRVHAFEMTSEVDANGYFVSTKHAIITFELEGFVSDETGSTHLNWFNHQNVLSGASVRQVVGGYELVLDGIYGVDGSLYCEKLNVTLEPGIPPGSIYELSARRSTEPTPNETASSSI
jgi:hypothetical protein